MYKLLVVVLMLALVSFGDVITINGGDLGDLDHYYASLWRIDLNEYVHLDADETITGATLYFDNITDWKDEPNDILWVNMVDPNYMHGANSVTRYWDHQNPANYFSVNRRQYSATSLVGTWSDPNSVGTADDISFDLDLSTLLAYGAHNDNNPMTDDIGGWIGFGFDGDCHYWNDGVRLVITTETASVPEPTLLSLLGCGLAGLVLVRRKK
ncbi:MAG: PEP-CTERM sorting domain-containing protein [Chitinispirillaceae bacterium]|nr:PEP-CTERM sorting domain-containing protein [Chitinispirillaceae bacterium]